MPSGHILKVYMKEDDKYHHTPLYEAMLQALKNHHVIWVDVQRAVEGFGQEHVIHKAHLFSFSEHPPVVLEAILEANTVESTLAATRPLLQAASGPAILLSGTVLK
ncbi:hypothetical protein GCM10025857_22120 [Alicyclobacillus contaminans]|uniref:DUF190 domain-containing protein n=1 Tax=Alicyclobacillus contaminans TaxID=392016 RepID=UPI0004118281|nr:DUF190 domain-containing protein [Alicyclobacillus contaminans]GMA50855.1 hypothetical protein GCM10025857_22120 [Alicyclobacillus contaminans]